MMPETKDVQALKRRLGPVGVWNSTLSGEPASVEREAAAEIESLGFGTLWIGETPTGKEALAHAAILLGATSSLTVATGIASIWGRDATAAANGANTLAEAYESRFVLGLGVSHAPAVAGRGHDYSKPVTAMREYLDAMDATEYAGPLPEPAPRLLAALRGRMLELAARRAYGAHPYFVTPEHTARARAALGPEPVLAPEQTVILESDPDRARQIARGFTARYLALPNYTNNLLDLGWRQDDLTDGGSDALVDAIVAWGDPDRIIERVRAHHEAGADHVCIQPLADSPQQLLEHLRVLARSDVVAS
ncbi:TIGR03620 family F420-dependent LLM class oxidoreductase [Nonomuraea gerenzanensis]|uniref:Coenzyme F420-dependent N5,N10-methylene tetrahydromethanopterin reductase and related flavin-dependent oxidoreductases n=1 Tax=Nonomuraea gerenzanensis TaxID=93944 RepID=A0A1M4E7Y0_9ACTN|nr:TIGR03620 family F420-dependent LLM class oxidoreductase [Nonomuraea gerenzanensis]UBU17118.1 TIGR03620 family F420-dependent LLM class oxidoreductase [Nonomuraea gerenzanensis]SBO94854.1 Coenzyme F420-dependent N5,N10-methylene tetrahydromethanopterin reductase and related flavin-dependent oxidoreductases [Nonomuraea gerenzanensis]